MRKWLGGNLRREDGRCDSRVEESAAGGKVEKLRDVQVQSRRDRAIDAPRHLEPLFPGSGGRREDDRYPVLEYVEVVSNLALSNPREPEEERRRDPGPDRPPDVSLKILWQGHPLVESEKYHPRPRMAKGRRAGDLPRRCRLGAPATSGPCTHAGPASP